MTLHTVAKDSNTQYIQRIWKLRVAKDSNTQYIQRNWKLLYIELLRTVIHSTYNAIENESTAGADASVEMPKLHNIKLLLVHDKQFNFTACKNSESG